MAQLRGMIHQFALQVLKPDAPVDNRGIDDDAQVLVNAHRENKAAMLFVKRGQVGAAAAESNPIWSARDDHGYFPGPGTAVATVSHFVCSCFKVWMQKQIDAKRRPGMPH